MFRSRRVQVMLSKGGLERMDELQRLTGASCHAEVMKRAMRLYDHLTTLAVAGCSITITKKDGTVESVAIFAKEPANEG